jgi:hypothetical protein
MCAQFGADETMELRTRAYDEDQKERPYMVRGGWTYELAWTGPPAKQRPGQEKKAQTGAWGSSHEQ